MLWPKIWLSANAAYFYLLPCVNMWRLYLNAGAPVWRGDHTAAVLVEARLAALGSSSQFLHKQKEAERKRRWLIQFPHIPSLKGTATCSVEPTGKPNMTVPEKCMVQLKHMELRLNGWQRHWRPHNSSILVGSVLKTHQNSHRSVPIFAAPVQAFLPEIVRLRCPLSIGQPTQSRPFCLQNFIDVGKPESQECNTGVTDLHNIKLFGRNSRFFYPRFHFVEVFHVVHDGGSLLKHAILFNKKIKARFVNLLPTGILHFVFTVRTPLICPVSLFSPPFQPWQKPG